jgi:hypothetical protein
VAERSLDCGPEQAPAPPGTPLKFGGDLYVPGAFLRPLIEAQKLGTLFDAARSFPGDPSVIESKGADPRNGKRDRFPALFAAAGNGWPPSW